MRIDFSSLLAMLDKNKHSKESIKSPVFEDNTPMPTPADPKAYQAFMAAEEDMRNEGESTEHLIDSVVSPLSQSIFDQYAPDSVTEEEYYAGDSMERPQVPKTFESMRFQPSPGIQDALVAEKFINEDVIKEVEKPKPSPMADFWGEVYQTESSDAKMADFDSDNKKYTKINTESRNHIANASQIAADVFAGDEKDGSGKGISFKKLSEVLNQTALHESEGGKYNEQKGGGPAQGYWQVEPETARDLLKNSRAYFGPKAKKALNNAMGKTVDLDNISDKDLKMLLKTPTGGAVFAGAKYLAGAKAKGRLDFLR